MSETAPINWRALTPVEQNRLVAATLFAWHPVPCDWEETVDSHGDAWCVGCGRRGHCIGFTHGIVEPCNYVKDWNAAWDVVLKIAGNYDRYVLATRTPIFEAFARIILTHNGDSWAWDEIYPAEEVLQVIAAWTPERIAIAALKAYGVEITEKEHEHGTDPR